MKPEYEVWISRYVEQCNGFVRGKCREATREMIAAFPELRQAAGFVYVLWGRDQHFWCVAPDGAIVDPTIAQFPPTLLGPRVLRYEELDLDDPEDRKKIPTGCCMDCGEPVYEHTTFCDADCEEATRRYMGID